MKRQSRNKSRQRNTSEMAVQFDLVLVAKNKPKVAQFKVQCWCVITVPSEMSATSSTKEFDKHIESTVKHGTSCQSSKKRRKTFDHNWTNSNKMADRKSRVFVGNLNTNRICKRSLHRMFARYGSVTAVSIHRGSQ
jgi:hypothetical protein